MKYFIGIDLGTSSVKVILLDSNGQVVSSVTKDYPLYFANDGWSEQSPEDWYNETISALSELLEDKDKENVASISFSGQMHGLVMLDKDDKVIRPAILWNDSRSFKETDELNKDKDFLLDSTGNIAFAGFTLPKLLWVKENEPENYGKIAKIMLPKDYLAYCLTDEFCTDVSDASGTLYFDVENRKWSDAILNKFGINEKMLPKVLESDEISGYLKSELAEKFGLGKVAVSIGAGDNAASAIGMGAVKDGDCNISLGTSGTIFTVSDSYNCDRKNAIHAFCSAGRNYHCMACILSAAVCCNWWVEKILRDDYSAVLSQENKLGDNNVLFLPYLMGERSPLNDTDIRGMFYGLSLNTEKDEMTLAVLEGVAFSLRHNMDIIRDLGVKTEKSTICGGGTKNKLWLKIIASILNVELVIRKNQDGGALGSAMLGAKGVLSAEEYSLLENKVYEVEEIIKPDNALSEKYEVKYQKWLKLYPAIRDVK